MLIESILLMQRFIIACLTVSVLCFSVCFSRLRQSLCRDRPISTEWLWCPTPIMTVLKAGERFPEGVEFSYANLIRPSLGIMALADVLSYILVGYHTQRRKTRSHRVVYLSHTMRAKNSPTRRSYSLLFRVHLPLAALSVIFQGMWSV